VDGRVAETQEFCGLSPQPSSFISSSFISSSSLKYKPVGPFRRYSKSPSLFLLTSSQCTSRILFKYCCALRNIRMYLFYCYSQIRHLLVV
jgi:hypothetical protein